MKRKVELVSNLAQLQNMIKRDPISYEVEFLTQYNHFKSKMDIFNLKPDEESPDFGELIMFLAAVAPCYPKHLLEYPQFVVDMLSSHYQAMSPDLRKTMVQSLMLMRNRNLLSQSSLLSLFFTLFRCKDKPLRVLLHNHIVSDIKGANQKAKNNKLNKTLQNFMYKMLQDPSQVAAKKSLEVMIELYHKNVWNDSKTVNVVAEACLSSIPKLVAPGVHFFLGTNDEKFDGDDDDEEGPDITSLRHANGVNKKTKARKSALDKAHATVKRKDRQKGRAEIFNFSALHLLNDPQDFAEHLFSRLRMASQKNTFNFELRLEMMNLISRLIGVHKLILLNFYDFVLSYIKPHQKNVTQILAYVAQSSHELVPPDALEPVVKTIADNFIWNNSSSESITAGLNSLREICIRAPLAMPEELLRSLMEDYKNHREKGPMMSARALLGLYRDFNPGMLKKKDRGKKASMAVKGLDMSQRAYGVTVVETDVPGVEFLNQDSDVDLDEESLEFDEGEEVNGSDSDYEDIEGEEILSDGDVLEVIEEEAEEQLKDVKVEKKLKATETIFTDEDFAKIRERKERQDAEDLVGLKRRSKPVDQDEDMDVVDVGKIMAFTRRKDDYEARMESIKEGREGRVYGSKKGKDERSSTTNREKSKKNKPMTMLVHKRSVTGKKSRSLIEKQRILTKHKVHMRKQK